MPNRLAGETSPYLRQHAGNPVDWFPWGAEAFAEARERDVPVLLSVGYSACHWCHVMAHESFEESGTAELMNQLFVNVKVDREERPDVDAIYMEAVQALTGHGGWPMTVFLDHEGRPFFGGTYFPPTARHGLPSFQQLLHAVTDAWTERRAELEDQGRRLTESIGQTALLSSDPAASLPGRDVLDEARQALAGTADHEWGGFGRAPKFPQTDALELLLRSRTPEALDLVRTTLDAMASGGIYDHLGGGFARYSVDAFWMVPHFEKMLYDQAQLAGVYLHLWQLTREPRYLQVLAETVTYVLRDLRHRDGGFYSAEDADSEGEEGTFYVWRIEELQELAPEAIEWYGATKAGNFEGANILHRPVRGDLVRTPEIEAARARLFAAREERVRPGLDDKVLTEWNALFLAALAEAAAATGMRDWLAAAIANGEFLLRELRREDGRWLRSWQADAGARHLAYAADYAALVDAFTRLAEATGEARWVTAARETADALLELFWDDERGGLFTVGSDGEQLVTRAKDVLDNATPSANSNAAFALARLAALTGDERYREHAELIVNLLADPLSRHPAAFTRLLQAVDLLTAAPTEIAIVGERPDLVEVVSERYLPHVVLAWGERYDSPLWEGRQEGYAYVCEGFVCKAPVSTVEDLVAQL